MKITDEHKAYATLAMAKAVLSSMTAPPKSSLTVAEQDAYINREVESIAQLFAQLEDAVRKRVHAEYAESLREADEKLAAAGKEQS